MQNKEEKEEKEPMLVKWEMSFQQGVTLHPILTALSSTSTPAAGLFWMNTLTYFFPYLEKSHHQRLKWSLFSNPTFVCSDPDQGSCSCQEKPGTVATCPILRTKLRDNFQDYGEEELGDCQAILTKVRVGVWNGILGDCQVSWWGFEEGSRTNWWGCYWVVIANYMLAKLLQIKLII